MTSPDYRLIDCDNHYYEVDDCFTRYIESRFRERTALGEPTLKCLDFLRERFDFE